MAGFVSYRPPPRPINQEIPSSVEESSSESALTIELTLQADELLRKASSIFQRIRDGSEANIDEATECASRALELYNRVLKRAKNKATLERKRLKARGILRELEKYR